MKKIMTMVSAIMVAATMNAENVETEAFTETLVNVPARVRFVKGDNYSFSVESENKFIAESVKAAVKDGTLSKEARLLLRDIDEIADHYLLYVDGEIAGCCRVFPSKDKGKYTLGRLAIRKKYRGKSYGSLIMRKVEAWIKKNSIPALELSAQVRVRPFYEALGYTASAFLLSPAL